ncbi:unnamed protein product [Prorocentrum cordatum]|uniref:Uncharacterized protein n=1 Tax=Prorocentrum cordatum TaxID=2364126 RepID=A0ABN9PDF8_9DINO|nr:unnamed protein product [Polarella glacialis]
MAGVMPSDTDGEKGTTMSVIAGASGASASAGTDDLAVTRGADYQKVPSGTMDAAEQKMHGRVAECKGKGEDVGNDRNDGVGFRDPWKSSLGFAYD